MSNTLLESLWTRVDANIGARITQISDLLTQALSANTESIAARDDAVVAEGNAASSASSASSSESRASISASNAASSEAAAKSAETAASGHAQSAQDFATSSLSAAERAELAAEETIQQVEGDFATRNYVDQKVASVPLTGTGSPEGNVAAPAGASYIDTAATNGAIRWIKTSGTGNTGWRVEYGDTGWRDITSTFDPPLQNGSVRIRKTPSEVQLFFYYVQATDGAASTLSSAFGTGSSTNFPLYSSSGANSGSALSHYSGRLTIERSTERINGVVTLPSATAWPVSLPGTPF